MHALIYISMQQTIRFQTFRFARAVNKATSNAAVPYTCICLFVLLAFKSHGHCQFNDNILNLKKYSSIVYFIQFCKRLTNIAKVPLKSEYDFDASLLYSNEIITAYLNGLFFICNVFSFFYISIIIYKHSHHNQYCI